MRHSFLTLLFLCLSALPLHAFTFGNIDGGTHDLTAWKGKTVLVVNTASKCGFTDQYGALQTLYERYRDQGLVVLAVPSGDFRQELATGEQVKEFCALHFGLTLPMTDITSVRGSDAHPFYKWVAETTGFVPRWNFNKVLIGPDGEVAGTYGATTKPLGRALTKEIETQLGRS